MQVEKVIPGMQELPKENCPLCESELEFHFESNEMETTIQEKVECPSCQLKVRDREYPMH